MKKTFITLAALISLASATVTPAFAWSTMMDTYGNGFYNFGDSMMGFGDYSGTTIFLWD